ncbi:MAG: peptidase [Phormidesmis sp. CAN_BIN36]|nr:peptidase [Phormidesmis sp. CAN_BIN36]
MAKWNLRRDKMHPLALVCWVGCILLALILQSPSLAQETLPGLKAHLLPPLLAQWSDPSNRGDYFDQIQKTQPDYLVWSEFPIKVYVQPIEAAEVANPARAQAWIKAVSQAVQEWSVYLPLQVVNQVEVADIVVQRSFLPLRVTSGQGSLPQRIRAAETRYELYKKSLPNAIVILAHRCLVVVQPNQAESYVLASARHELGHALGIWGHSSLETDALYFSQVRNPPLISPRDVNTLKRIYEQPTRLGWAIPE